MFQLYQYFVYNLLPLAYGSSNNTAWATIVAVLTENEARKRWCPHARVALKTGMAANRSGAKAAGLNPDDKSYGNVYDETRCLASDCMMWEWLGPRTPSKASRGYCGLTVAVGLES